MKKWNKRWLSVLVCSMAALMVSGAAAETCTTQSQMQAAERETLASSAQTVAAKVQANDQTGLQSGTIPEYATNFSGIGQAVSSTAPHLAGDTAEIDQVYVLDATDKKRNPDGSMPDAEFLCTLNKGADEADFSITALPPGRYAFAMVRFAGKSPWLVSMLLRQDGAEAPWKLAGIFPREESAAGHDGLWYWGQGRTLSSNKQPWSAYINYEEARQLLQPAVFVSSTHLENLRVELSGAAPPELSNGISADAPLVVKGIGGKEYRFTSIGPDDSLHNDKLDVAVRMMPDSTPGDPAAVRKLDLDAMSALL